MRMEEGLLKIQIAFWFLSMLKARSEKFEVYSQIRDLVLYFLF